MMAVGVSGYFGILPAPVRYDRRLKASEKLAYCEFSAITGSGGFCITDSTEIGKKMDCTPATAESYLSSLEKCGYISISPCSNNRLKISLLPGTETQGGSCKRSGIS